jgi:hypothetical protein
MYPEWFPFDVAAVIPTSTLTAYEYFIILTAFV